MKFNLGDYVRITRSDECGRITARAEYLHSKQPSYLLQYTAADGRAVEGWFGEDELIGDDA